MATVGTKYGTLAVHEDNDPWFAHSIQKHKTQIDDVEIALSWISKDSIVVDVGAHVGLFTIPFAKKAKYVYAIEPNEDSRVLLEKNIKDNGVADNVIVLSVVAADAQKSFTKRENLPHAETQYYETVGSSGVIGKPLDTLVREVNFIKIDVEGMELSVLRGASTLIDKWRPTIFFEINKKSLDDQKNNRSDIQRFFSIKKYNLYRVEDGKLNKIFSVNQALLMNVLAIPCEIRVVATNPFVYLIGIQLKRRLAVIFKKTKIKSI